MFVQVMEGSTSDPAALHARFDRWNNDLKPGAAAFLGSTGGVSGDGQAVILARFESAAAAKANSERPEQGEWWAQTEACFDGPVRFSESTDVETFLNGGSDDAGFVQIMRGSGADRARLVEADAMWADFVAAWRPDLIGGIRVWTGSDTYVEVAYFTSQAAAQVGEQTEPPAEFAQLFAEFEELMAGVEFLDIAEPLLSSG